MLGNNIKTKNISWFYRKCAHITLTSVGFGMLGSKKNIFLLQTEAVQWIYKHIQYNYNKLLLVIESNVAFLPAGALITLLSGDMSMKIKQQVVKLQLLKILLLSFLYGSSLNLLRYGSSVPPVSI